MTEQVVMKIQEPNLSASPPTFTEITVYRDGSGALGMREEQHTLEPFDGELPAGASGNCYETEVVYAACVGGTLKITTIVQLWCGGQLVSERTSVEWNGACA